MDERRINNAYMHIIEKLPSRMREFRKSADLPQAKLAAFAGITTNAYSRLENGESRPGKPMNPRLHTLLALSDAYYINLLQLLDVDDKYTDLYEKSLEEKLTCKPPNVDARELSKALGQRLCDLRLAHDMSQEQAALAADITRRVYVYLEKGESSNGDITNPTLKTLVGLATAFGLDIVELLNTKTKGSAKGKAKDNSQGKVEPDTSTRPKEVALV